MALKLPGEPLQPGDRVMTLSRDYRGNIDLRLGGYYVLTFRTDGSLVRAHGGVPKGLGFPVDLEGRISVTPYESDC